MAQKNLFDVILLGPPGVGKGTQAKLLGEALSLAHVSTGDLLRTEVKNKSPLGLQVQALMQRGELVSDEVVAKLIESFLLVRLNTGVIFDGYPRTVSQAEELGRILSRISEKSSAQRGLKVLSLKATHKTIIERLSGRRTCENCGKGYHIIFSPSKSGDNCEHCGSSLVIRPDDQPKTIQRRLDIYEAQTQPLLDYYTAKGSLVTLEAESGPQEILSQAIRVLG